MSTFRWCTCTGNVAKVCHLLSNWQVSGEACTGSFLVVGGYAMCTGSIVVPDDDQQLAMLTAWKLGGWTAVAAMVEASTGLTVQR